MSTPDPKYRYTYAAWAEAFAIFSRYEPGRGDVAVGSDQILAGPNPENVNEEDRRRLEELGWSPGREECFYRFV